jgi:hypothetical protein
MEYAIEAEGLVKRYGAVATIVVLAIQGIVALINAVGLIVPGPGGAVGDDAVSAAGLSIGGLTSLAFVASGLATLRRDRFTAFRRFQRAVLTSLLLTQVFQFAVNEFSACAFVAVDLTLLALLGAEVHRHRPPEQNRNRPVTREASRGGPGG